MIRQTATVIRRQGRHTEVEIQRQSVCGSCELEPGCGTGAIGRLLGQRKRPLIIESDADLRVGDQVILAMPEAVVARASLLIYGLPLLGMLVFGLIAQILFNPSEWLVAAAAGAGFLAGFKLARRLARNLAQTALAPEIVDIRVNPGRLSES